MANEHRLIDANALLTLFEEEYKQSTYPYFHIDEIADEIIKAPTVDAVEVVHGRWEEQKEWDFKARDYFLAGYTCSCCGFWYLNQQKYNYCPNCGAKMDGERKDNG